MSEEKDPVWDALMAPETTTAPRKREAVFENSSTLKEARYDSLLQTLTVSFKTSPGVYSYFEVPSDVANTFLSSAGDGSSAGKYFIKYIKNNYPFKRIS